MNSTALRVGLLSCALSLAAVSVSAKTLQVSITNNAPSDGLFLTPLVSLFHDGSVDTFDTGTLASDNLSPPVDGNQGSLEALAEDGIAGGVLDDAAQPGSGVVAAGVVLGPDGFDGAPVIDPGETATERFRVSASGDIFFSYLSMIIPSNDIFVGNNNPEAWQVFADGVFAGPITFAVTRAYDAGTEANNGEGAAFSNGNPSTDTNEVITFVPEVTDQLGLTRAKG